MANLFIIWSWLVNKSAEIMPDQVQLKRQQKLEVLASDMFSHPRSKTEFVCQILKNGK